MKSKKCSKEYSNPIFVIAGATATGKTALAVELAKKTDGEIISADSMQVYKYMDIGTAKPSAEEKQGIRHYMIDEVYPDEAFSVAEYKARASACLNDIQKRSKTAIIAGGTGFYINALIKDTEFENVSANPKLREKYEKIATDRGRDFLYDILLGKDPKAASNIHPNNVKRVIRALEYFEVSGHSIDNHNKKEKQKMIAEDIYFINLTMDRETLYERINYRVDKMMQQGLLNEVGELLEKGYGENLTSMQGIGYKELVGFLKGGYSLDTAIEKIKQGSRNYAKRQITWFKNQNEGIRLNALEVSENIDRLVDLWRNNGRS